MNLTFTCDERFTALSVNICKFKGLLSFPSDALTPLCTAAGSPATWSGCVNVLSCSVFATLNTAGPVSFAVSYILHALTGLPHIRPSSVPEMLS